MMSPHPHLNVTAPPRRSSKPRLAVVVSHPIQYYAPYYRAIAADNSVEIRVFFSSRIGLDNILDPAGMGVEISWKTDLLSGYEHVFLPEAPEITRTSYGAVDNPSIAAHLSEYEPDVVLLHGYAQKTMLRALWWSRKSAVPVMNISDRSFFGLSALHRRMARRVVLPLIVRQFTAFLVIGDSIHEFYQSFGARPDQIFRVPNMLDAGFWTASEEKGRTRARVRAQLGLKDEFVVLYVGKLIPRKRPQDLLAALELLKRSGEVRKPISVIFAGDGEMRQELETFAERNHLPAQFLGFVNIDRLPECYCAADALAHPAEYESYGIIALEAAVFGLPLILSDRVGAIGPTSIARPGENTLVHECGNVEALSAAIRRLAGDPHVVEAMSQASSRLANNHRGEMSVRNTVRAIDFCLNRVGARRLRRADATH